ncbi:hypothetical protein AgCh_022074 [Apium graveolens]
MFYRRVRPSTPQVSHPSPPKRESPPPQKASEEELEMEVETNLSEIVADLGLRKDFNKLAPNEKDDNARGNNDAFVSDGFRNWKKPDRLLVHVGEYGSIHYQCQNACEDLMNRKQHIDLIFCS